MVCVTVVCDVFTIHVFYNLCMLQLNRLSFSTSSLCISSVLVIALSCLVLLLMWIDYILLALGLIVLLTTKSQGQKHTNHPNIPDDSFLLILQTNFQLELHKKHASTSMCLASTHGTNQYRVKPVTVVFPDEYGKCILAAICIYAHDILFISLCTGHLFHVVCLFHVV